VRRAAGAAQGTDSVSKEVNTWVGLSYVPVAPKQKASTVCSVPGCGKPRARMNEKYFRKMCKKHHAEWLKAYQENRKLREK